MNYFQTLSEVKKEVLDYLTKEMDLSAYLAKVFIGGITSDWNGNLRFNINQHDNLYEIEGIINHFQCRGFGCMSSVLSKIEQRLGMGTEEENDLEGDL